MSEKNLLIVLLVLCNFQANAQQVLVCDGATRFPLRDVETLADDKPVGKTDYLGHIVLPENFSTATFRQRVSITRSSNARKFSETPCSFSQPSTTSTRS